MNKRNEYKGIDLAKFICSLFVIAIHVPPLGFHSPINNYISGYIARLAVPFFFITSSYFLYDKYLKTPDSRNSIIKNYLARIVKLYFIWSVIYLPISVVQIYKLNGGFDVEVVFGYFRQVLFVGSFVHLWYLVALIVSVILFSLMLRLFKKHISYIYILCTLLYGIGLLGQGYSLDYDSHIPRTLNQALTSCISIYDNIFETTRNGVFEAPIFIAIGYYFAKNKITSKNKLLMLIFILLLIAMYCEIHIITDSFIKSYDYYILLVPSSACLFLISLNAKLSISTDLSLLMRKMSSIIFFSHYWVAFGINNVLKLCHIDITASCGWFILTMTITILSSYILIKLSYYKRFGFLKQLY